MKNSMKFGILIFLFTTSAGMQKRVPSLTELAGRSLLKNNTEIELLPLSNDLKNYLRFIEFLEGNENSQEALFVAIQEDHVDYIRHLIALDVDLNARKSGRTPLMMAAKRSSSTMVRLFLEAGARVTDEDRSGRTALFDAIFVCPLQGYLKDNLEVIKTLILSGIDVDKADKTTQFPLLIMVDDANSRPGSIEVIKLLISLKANLNKQDMRGNTALIRATSIYRCGGTYSDRIKRIIKLLVDNGARIDIQNNNGQTAITMAGNEEMEQFLKEKLKIQQEKMGS